MAISLVSLKEGQVTRDERKIDRKERDSRPRVRSVRPAAYLIKDESGGMAFAENAIRGRERKERNSVCLI
jgi:hypothetical protein